MPRYIDADKFHEWVYPNWSYCAQNDDDFHDAIDAQPTADVAPVAHAFWICKSVDDNDNGEYTCSRCGCGEEHSISCEVPYCWRCGAKMDGVIYNE